MRISLILILGTLFLSQSTIADAQQINHTVSGSAGVFSAQKEARNLAVIKAVANYKINDEETYNDMVELRENQRFNQQLQGMLNKLSNAKNKNGKNAQVYKILQKAGNDIYNILN